MKIILKNSTGVSGIMFLRGIGMNVLNYNGQNIAEDPNYDCTTYSGEQSTSKYGCVPYGDTGSKRTFYFNVEDGQQIELTLPEDQECGSGNVWFVPDTDTRADNVKGGGPGSGLNAQEQFEMNIPIRGDIYFDLTLVEGIQAGVRASYTRDDDEQISITCIPNEKPSLNIYERDGVPRILSDKNDPSYDEKYRDLAGCPGSYDTACKQHECRSQMAASYQNPDSYCSWLLKSKCQGYCWAYDEWMCKDQSCGYGQADQPPSPDSPDFQDVCNQMLSIPGYASNVYSCGKGTNLSAPNQGKWWTNGPGCEDKTVNGQPTNPVLGRENGTLFIEFVNLPWLSPPPTQDWHMCKTDGTCEDKQSGTQPDGYEPGKCASAHCSPPTQDWHMCKTDGTCEDKQSGTKPDGYEPGTCAHADCPQPKPSPSPSSDDKEKKNLWWLWVLLIIGILLVVATLLMIWYIRKMKKEKRSRK